MYLQTGTTPQGRIETSKAHPFLILLSDHLRCNFCGRVDSWTPLGLICRGCRAVQFEIR